MISFVIPGAVKPKERARGGRGNFYTPSATRAQEDLIAQLSALAMRGKQMMLGPVKVEVEAVFTPPESWSDEKRESAYYCVNGGDGDNICKSVFDGMQGVVFKNDKQVALFACSKIYSLTKGPCVRVAVSDLTQPPYTRG